jgi:hypothetical protein
VDTRLDTVKLSVAEKTSALLANVLAGIVVALVFICFIFFGSIALALLLGSWMGAWWLGFLIVAGIYLLLGLITWLARGRLIRLPIMNAMIRQLFNRLEYDEDEND